MLDNIKKILLKIKLNKDLLKRSDKSFNNFI
jgi:hypothetical protein